MSAEAQLISAIAALWLTLTGLAGGAIAYLRGEIALGKKDCLERTTKLEAKLDSASAIILKQGEAQQAQIVAQQQMIVALQTALTKVGEKP